MQTSSRSLNLFQSWEQSANSRTGKINFIANILAWLYTFDIQFMKCLNQRLQVREKYPNTCNANQLQLTLLHLWEATSYKKSPMTIILKSIHLAFSIVPMRDIPPSYTTSTMPLAASETYFIHDSNTALNKISCFYAAEWGQTRPTSSYKFSRINFHKTICDHRNYLLASLKMMNDTGCVYTLLNHHLVLP